MPLSLLTDLGEPPLPPTNLKKSLLLPIKSLSTLAKKKPYYIIVPTKEAKLKKKINSNVGEQNTVIGKKIKIQLKAYIGFLTNITKDQSLLA